MGERGAMGLQGPPGKDGSSYRPTEWFICELLLDLIAGNAAGQDGLQETGLLYKGMRYSSGDLDVSCTSRLGSATSATNEAYFPAVVPGARSGVCASNADYPESINDLVAGQWVYELSPQPHATYNDDSRHWLNGKTFTFGENDCRAYTADERGMWHDAALSDVL